MTTPDPTAGERCPEHPASPVDDPSEVARRRFLTEPVVRPTSLPAVAASTGTSEDVESLATLLRRHNDMPDGNNRYTSDLQDALFNVWAEADDNVGDYEIGERLAEAAIKSITDTASDWLAAREAAARAEERERITQAIEAETRQPMLRGIREGLHRAARIAREVRP